VKLSAKQIRIHCLRDAIDWQVSLLDCIKGCTDESSKKARDLGEKLLIEYRKQLFRLLKLSSAAWASEALKRKRERKI
jgi:hypothetical protein